MVPLDAILMAYAEDVSPLGAVEVHERLVKVTAGLKGASAVR